MARDGSVKEEIQQHVPMDVMVATFADRAAARDAYRTLKEMNKEGRIGLDGAVVIDRDEMGKVHLQGAVLPRWVWAFFGIAAALMTSLTGLLVWGLVRAVSGLVRGGGGPEGARDYSESGGEPSEAERMALE